MYEIIQVPKYTNILNSKEHAAWKSTEGNSVTRITELDRTEQNRTETAELRFLSLGQIAISW
jgi:hypothetical protein